MQNDTYPEFYPVSLSCTPCTACWKSYLQKNFPDDRKSQKTFSPDELSKKANTPLTIETPPHNTHKTPHKKGGLYTQ